MFNKLLFNILDEGLNMMNFRLLNFTTLNQYLYKFQKLLKHKS